MGDADYNEVLSMEEIETYMQEAMEEVDNGLENLFDSIELMNEQTKYLQAQIDSWEKFKHCFAAMNLFVIPVILAIGLCYGTRETLDSSSLEAGLQLVITFLMYLSGSIGFPLYLYTLWESYFPSIEEPIESRNIKLSHLELNTNHDTSSVSPPSHLDLSNEQLEEVARVLSSRVAEGMRMDAGRRASMRDVEPDERRNRSTRRVSLRRDNTFQREYETSQVYPDHDDDHVEEKHESGVMHGISATNDVEIKETDFYGVKVIIVNSNPDLSVGFEKRGEPPTAASQLIFNKDENKREEAWEDNQDTTSSKTGEGDIPISTQDPNKISENSNSQ